MHFELCYELLSFIIFLHTRLVFISAIIHIQGYAKEFVKVTECERKLLIVGF